MSRLFYHVMQDNAGNLLFDVSGTMRLAGTGTTATIYGDEALTVILPNPMTNHPSFGSFKCFLGAGDYDFYMAKSGYSFETLTGVQGLGTMAQQNADAVAITGGTAILGDSRFTGRTGFGGTPTDLELLYIRSAAGYVGVKFNPVPSGTVYPVLFQNSAGTSVGSIATTDTTTVYNTSSDARLKHAITALTGALDVVQALRPVAFQWRSDNAPGVGFIAQEVAQVVQGVVTGEPDAVDADGTIMPMQIDLSKLVPWLTAALQALAEQGAALVGVAQDAHEQTQALTARVAALEGAML